MYGVQGIYQSNIFHFQGIFRHEHIDLGVWNRILLVGRLDEPLDIFQI